MISIEPFPAMFMATQVEVTMPLFSLNATDGTVLVDLYTTEQRVIERKTVYVPPDIYSQWGSDDNFIIDYVLNEIGIVRQDSAQSDS